MNAPKYQSFSRFSILYIPFSILLYVKWQTRYLCIRFKFFFSSLFFFSFNIHFKYIFIYIRLLDIMHLIKLFYELECHIMEIVKYTLESHVGYQLHQIVWLSSLVCVCLCIWNENIVLSIQCFLKSKSARCWIFNHNFCHFWQQFSLFCQCVSVFLLTDMTAYLELNTKKKTVQTQNECLYKFSHPNERTNEPIEMRLCGKIDSWYRRVCVTMWIKISHTGKMTNT